MEETWRPISGEAPAADAARDGPSRPDRAGPPGRLRGLSAGLATAFTACMRGARTAASAALGLALPPTCLACDRLVASDDALCARCWAEMPLLAPPWCARLGLPFAYDLGEGAVSPQAIARPPVFDRLRAAVDHDGPARALVSRLKYHDRPAAARLMGRLMAQAGAELLTGAPGADRDADRERGRDRGADMPPLLVPVPLHRLRHWSRRYNQSALLAREVAAATGLEVAAFALLRQRATRRQVGLDAAARARNVRGAFAASAEGALLLPGRRVVLVDDVYTTGATIAAATRAALRAGAASVDVLTFAHAGARRLTEAGAGGRRAAHGEGRAAG